MEQESSLLKGKRELLRKRNEPILLHSIFEETLKAIERFKNGPNEDVHISHGITILTENPELIFGEDKLSFTQLNALANQLARYIQAEFPSRANSDGDTVIAVNISPSLHLIVALLAIWKLGAAYLPLDDTFPGHRIRHILMESQPALVIADVDDEDDRYSDYDVINCGVIKKMIENQSTADLDKRWTDHVPDIEQIAIILYTSGSTGVPKGVRIPHRAILNRLKWQWETFPYSNTENVCVFKTALTFVDSVSEIWGPLLYGRSLLIMPKSKIADVEAFIQSLEAHKIERLILVPSLLRSMLLYIGWATKENTPFRPSDAISQNRYLPSIKFFICSGEELSLPLAQKFYQFFRSENHLLLNFYGSTEVMGDVLFARIMAAECLKENYRIPIGTPINNTNVYVLDKQLRPVASGEVGELYVSGSSVAVGYVRSRDADLFLYNPHAHESEHVKMYKTGDFASIANGSVHYEGRADSQIKIRGHKVDLSEIESAFSKLSCVEKHSVLVYKQRQIDQALLAFVTIKKPEESKGKDIEGEIAELVPTYMVPEVIILENMPYLVNGKVDRQTLLRYYDEKCKKGDSDFSLVDYSKVPEKYQRQAKALFETVVLTLGDSLKENLAVTSNYYQLGGNSLNSVFAVLKLRDLGFLISIADFTSANTMMDIIMRMNEEVQTAHFSVEALNMIPNDKYITEIMNNQHKEIAGRMLSESFYEKGIIEQLLKPDLKLADEYELFEPFWEFSSQQKLSFLVKNQDEEIIGAAMNVDAYGFPNARPSSKLRYAYDLVMGLEEPLIKHVLPKGSRQVMRTLGVATAPHLTSQQNVDVILFMEHKLLNIARKSGFAGVLTCNINPLTVQLANDVFEYKILAEYQINKFIAEDGTKPFGHAKDSDKITLSWKEL